MIENEISWDSSLIRMVEERLKSENHAEYEKLIKLDKNEKLEYINKNKNSLYFEFDKKLLHIIGTALHPLLEKVITEEVNKELCESFMPRSQGAWHNIIEFRIILQKYANEIKNRSDEEESRLSLPYYLNIVESKFTADVNLIVYLLIKSSLEYYRTKDKGEKEYVKINNLKRVAKENLHNKLTFLKENGFSVISDVCDRYLRNGIAHMEFIVFKDGSVAYENKSKVIIISKNDLDSKIEQLLNVCQCLTESIKQFYNQKYSFARQ